MTHKNRSRPWAMLASAALTVATAGNVAMAGTSVTATATASGYVTQAQAIQDLMAAFSRIPSMPGRPTPDTTYITVPDTIYPKGDNSPASRLRYWGNYVMMHGITYAYQSPKIDDSGAILGGGYTPITPTAWIGLQCVFPDVPQSQWASKLGIIANTPNAPATARQVADWIVDWAHKARNVLPGVRGIPSDPYTLVKDFTGFDGTDVVGPASQVSAGDMKDIGANLYDMSVGYRLLGSAKLEVLPVLGLSNLVGPHANDVSDYQKGFALVSEGITLTFDPNGDIVYHRPNVSGMDVYLHEGRNGTEAFGGYDWRTLFYNKPHSNPDFYGPETVVFHMKPTGQFTYASGVADGFVTPDSWKDKYASAIGGLTTGATVSYSNGSIVSVDPFGRQYSMNGYPGR